MKILIIRFSSIGDIVLTTPVVRCVKTQLPDAEVHFLTKRAHRRIAKHNPYIDKHFYLRRSLSDTIKELRRYEYDYIIDLHNNLRSAFVKVLLTGKSYAVRKLNFEKWLLVNLRINWLPNTHLVDRYMETVSNLGVHNDGEGLDSFIARFFFSLYGFGAIATTVYYNEYARNYTQN